jgi:hypothetical protein
MGASDPFVMARFGGSPRTGTALALTSTEGITARENPRARVANSLGPAKPLSCEPLNPSPVLFGASSKTTAANGASTAPSSETKGRRSQASLSDRLMPSLITLGLVKGINPKAVRSANPGFCFRMAGWRRCGITLGGLLIFERGNAA